MGSPREEARELGQRGAGFAPGTASSVPMHPPVVRRAHALPSARRAAAYPVGIGSPEHGSPGRSRRAEPPLQVVTPAHRLCARGSTPIGRVRSAGHAPTHMLHVDDRSFGTASAQGWHEPCCDPCHERPLSRSSLRLWHQSGPPSAPLCRAAPTLVDEVVAAAVAGGVDGGRPALLCEPRNCPAH